MISFSFEHRFLSFSNQYFPFFFNPMSSHSLNSMYICCVLSGFNLTRIGPSKSRTGTLYLHHLQNFANVPPTNGVLLQFIFMSMVTKDHRIKKYQRQLLALCFHSSV